MHTEKCCRRVVAIFVYLFVHSLLPLRAAAQQDHLYVVVDDILVTGQNEQSTLTAVQNLILLSNAQ